MLESILTKLKSENQIGLININDQDRLIIKKVMRSLSFFRVNSFDSQIIQRDLIGMAQELQIRNSSLSENIGDDLKGFTSSIVEGSNGPCYREIIIRFILKLSGFFFIWFSALSLLAYGSIKWDSNPIIFFYFIGTVLLSFISEGLIEPLYITEIGIKKNLHTIFSVILFFALTLIVFLINDRNNTVVINSGIIILISGVAYLISIYLNNMNISRLAKRRKYESMNLE